MQALIRSIWIPALLGGLMLLNLSCEKSDSGALERELYYAGQAEEALLEAVPIDSGAVVSLVGPVPTMARLYHHGQEYELIHLTVPDTTVGRIYLFFINDHPDLRYVHPVRYAWLNLTNGAFDTLRTDWWPSLETVPPDTMPFQLIAADVRENVLFYYGQGGGRGFPPSYLEQEGP